MISKMKVRNGYALNLELFGKEIEFDKGLNILFGPNGCGKTTALNIAAAYSGVQTKGWSRAPDPLGIDKKIDYPQCFSKPCVGNINAEVEWDGTPSYFATSSGEVVVPHAFDDNDMMNQLQIMFEKPSSGQLRLRSISKMMDDLMKKPTPDLTVPDLNYVNDSWKETRRKFSNYVATLPRNGPITLLLDEPDRSLSIPVQFDLWTKAIPQWATKAQIIVATHSPFCLVSPGARIIECVSGYREDCLAALHESFRN